MDQTEAPLNEVLAAGMILKTGWKGESNFVDPMCGSGTLLIEAAMIALNIAPGVHRKEFAFEKWIDFDQELFDRIYNDGVRNVSLISNVMVPISIRRRSRLPRRISVVPV